MASVVVFAVPAALALGVMPVGPRALGAAGEGAIW
jgi:hypothetical protein